MMRKYLINIFIAFAIFLSACDKIEEPFMSGNTSNSDTSDIKQQYVLVEYFTGHRCPNCPKAAQQLKVLKEVYKDKLIFISVHAGSFAIPMGVNYSQTDYRTPVGDELDGHFKLTEISTPNGLVNRKKLNNDIVIPPDSWGTMIAEEISQKPQMNINISQAIIENNDAKVKIKTDVLEELEGTFMISMYIVEDSIQSYQKNNNEQFGLVPDISDYIHRFVLRGSMNGTWGDMLHSGILSQGQAIEKDFNMSLSDKWNLDKLYIVCFIYNRDTEEIIQVQMKRFIKK